MSKNASSTDTLTCSPRLPLTMSVGNACIAIDLPPMKTTQDSRRSHMTDDIRRLIDRAGIQDLMARYARSVDRRDWDAVRSTFHPDAHDDHGDYKGDVDGFITWVSERHAKISQS